MNMENIISFSPRPRSATPVQSGEQPATVIIFPGVRYERREDAPEPAGARSLPDRRLS